MYLPLLAAILPFILWLVEIYLPFPYFVEEIAKALCLYPTVKEKSSGQRFLAGLVFGSIFTFSESIFYLIKIYNFTNSQSIFIQRLILTTSLHVGTALIISLGAKKGKFLKLILATSLAIAIHYLYNTHIS